MSDDPTEPDCHTDSLITPHPPAAPTGCYPDNCQFVWAYLLPVCEAKQQFEGVFCRYDPEHMHGWECMHSYLYL